MKTMTINAPEGYEIDKENSTFEKIVFKEKSKLPMKWEDLKTIEGFYITSDSVLCKTDPKRPAIIGNENIWKTKELAEASLALNQLIWLRDAWGGYRFSVSKQGFGILCCSVDLIYFKDKETRDNFQSTFADLIETAKPLL